MKATLVGALLLASAALAVAGCSGSSSGGEASATQPPRVVSLEPSNGATDVSPGVIEAAVTFDQPMGGGMSMTTRGGPDKFPEITGKPAWSADKKTITATMRLEPNREYVIGLNSSNHSNFKNERGLTLEPVIWKFTTGS